MRFRLHLDLRRIASSLMLLGALAFVQQGAMIGASQAAAFSGSMPDAAVVLNGPIHFHDDLARHVHMHGGNNGAGHVHGTADHDHEDSDEAGKTLLWTLGGSSAVIAMMATCAVSFEVACAVNVAPQGRPDGVRPDGLIRPPSTPGIA